jgi:hypothetical protein
VATAASRRVKCFGFDHARGFLVHVEQVVGAPDIGTELADRHAEPRGDVHVLAALHQPPGLDQRRVDAHTGALLGLLVGIGARAWHVRAQWYPAVQPPIQG